MLMTNTIRCFDTRLEKINKCEGMYLYSKKRKILDVTAGGTSFAVLGWSQKKIIEAINKQNRKFCHIDYKIWEDENINKLSKLLLSQAEHKLDAVYYPGNSGSDACEAAMKLSFQTHQAQGNKKKKMVYR